MKALFVFNVHYPKQTAVVYTLFQHNILAIDGSLSAKAMKVCSELAL